MSPKFRPARIAFALAAHLAPAWAGPAMAADASPFDGTQRAAVRLIAGASSSEGGATIHRAGVEIRLAPGWKTYWRYPGDSGIPPRFDFSQSTNVKSVTVRYPAPQRLTDDSGTSIGYKHGVVFPLEVVAQDSGRPVTLSVAIDYAVCEKLCVPADGKAELTLTGAPSMHVKALGFSDMLVPRSANIGEGEFAVRSVTREGKRVVVDVAFPAGRAVDLFAEGPTGDWALPVPTPIAGAPSGQQRFAFEIDGLPPGAKPEGATLMLTAVVDDGAIEVPYRLDSAN
jgi:DsbC/DsbD-like thiol-disulfide interchange protein